MKLKRFFTDKAELSNDKWKENINQFPLEKFICDFKK